VSQAGYGPGAAPIKVPPGAAHPSLATPLNAKRSWGIVSTLVLRLKAAESFLETSQCTLRTQERGSAEKSGLRDAKRADFIRY